VASSRLAAARRSVLGSATVGELVAAISELLGDREASDLVAALLDVPRHWPTLHASDDVDAVTFERALIAADKRARGAPLAYAVGLANFRSLTLAVDERVLIPRPETELLVDLVLQRAPAGGVAIDVGTGSGAIAIALATEGHFDRVIATDISTDALALARENATRNRARVEFVASDLLSAENPPPRSGWPRTGFAVVVSNPPYIAYHEISALPASVRDWEPATALFSGGDGLATTARLVRQAARSLAPGGLLALEVDARRASLVAELIAARGEFREVSVQLDLAGRERFVLATRHDGTTAERRDGR
jgi:release factor glutamine methyltransferase